MSEEKILKIKLNDGEVIYLEEDVYNISVGINEGVIVFYNRQKAEDFLFSAPVGSIKYYRFINKEDKEQIKSCHTCKHSGTEDCFSIVGRCNSDYNKWEAK